MGGAGECDAGCEAGGSWTGGIHSELQQEEPRNPTGTLERHDNAFIISTRAQGIVLN